MRTPRAFPRGTRAEPLSGGWVLAGRLASAAATSCGAEADSFPGRSDGPRRNGLNMTGSTAKQTVVLALLDIWLPFRLHTSVDAGVDRPVPARCSTPPGSNRVPRAFHRLNPSGWRREG